MSNFSSFWRPEKAIPAVSLNPPIKANCLHDNNCSTFLLFENVILQRFKRSSVQGYLGFIQIQLIIMATRKKDSLIVLRPSAQGYVANCDLIIGNFCGLKTLFIVRRETHA
jgi:hypothetical protein